jgi:glycosyltransferase involved in cell wall biosynthesis
MRFSLIIATYGRTEELARLLASVRRQRHDVEVIVVDQNLDDRVARCLEETAAPFEVRHLRTALRNVCAARNLGLEAATGEVVAFPDDDCWYPDGLLDGVEEWFRLNPRYGILAVGAEDEQGIPSGNRWIRPRCDIRSWNALRTTFCSSLFITAVEQSRHIRFDPALHRGEETDFVLRLMAAGVRGRFDRSMTVGHPRRDMLSGTITSERAASYGAGMGALVRRHSLRGLWAALLLYDCARAAAVLCRGRRRDVACCLAHARGLVTGFLMPEAWNE